MNSLLIQGKCFRSYRNFPWNLLPRFGGFVAKAVPQKFGWLDEEDLWSELDRKGSWLSSDQRYKRIKRMYQEGRIVHLRLGITNKAAFKNIKSWLYRHKHRVDTIYVSNIYHWITQTARTPIIRGRMAYFEVGHSAETPIEIIKSENRLHFAQNLAGIIDDQTILIDAESKKRVKPDPHALLHVHVQKFAHEDPRIEPHFRIVSTQSGVQGASLGAEDKSDKLIPISGRENKVSYLI